MSDTYDTIVRNSRIIGPASGDGAATRNRYDGDGSTTWAKGELVELSSGTISQVLDSDTAQILDTDDIDSGAILFVATEAVGSATSDKVAVQRIKHETIFEGPLVSSAAAQSTPPTAPASIIGTQYALWAEDGRFAPDKNNTSNPVVEIVDVDANFRPWHDDDLYNHSSADAQRYNFVRFKFLDSRISND